MTQASGTFVCVVGPSGAGKDTLLAEARRLLAGDQGIVFPRRLVTRAGNSAEDHETISMEAFRRGVSEGSFALHWEAHGLGYALPGEVSTMLAAGTTVVCNISRAVIPEVFARFGHAYVVLITAPPDVIGERLRKRGREGGASIAARMERSQKLSAALAPDLTIMNTGPVETGGARLAAFLRRVANKSAALPAL